MTDSRAPISYDRTASIAEQLHYFRMVGVIGDEPTAAAPVPRPAPARRRQLDPGPAADSSSTS